MLKQCLENIGEGLLHACISSYVDIHDKNDEANEKSEDSHSEEAIKSASKKSKPITGKGKPSKMQVAFENAMKEHNTYLKESDKMFLYIRLQRFNGISRKCNCREVTACSITIL
jgi:hypothetical protein